MRLKFPKNTDEACPTGPTEYDEHQGNNVSEIAKAMGGATSCETYDQMSSEDIFELSQSQTTADFKVSVLPLLGPSMGGGTDTTTQTTTTEHLVDELQMMSGCAAVSVLSDTVREISEQIHCTLNVVENYTETVVTQQNTIKILNQIPKYRVNAAAAVQRSITGAMATTTDPTTLATFQAMFEASAASTVATMSINADVTIRSGVTVRKATQSLMTNKKTCENDLKSITKATVIADMTRQLDNPGAAAGAKTAISTLQDRVDTAYTKEVSKHLNTDVMRVKGGNVIEIVNEGSLVIDAAVSIVSAIDLEVNKMVSTAIELGHTISKQIEVEALKDVKMRDEQTGTGVDDVVNAVKDGNAKVATVVTDAFVSAVAWAKLRGDNSMYLLVGVVVIVLVIFGGSKLGNFRIPFISGPLGAFALSDDYKRPQAVACAVEGWKATFGRYSTVASMASVAFKSLFVFHVIEQIVLSVLDPLTILHTLRRLLVLILVAYLLAAVLHGPLLPWKAHHYMLWHRERYLRSCLKIGKSVVKSSTVGTSGVASKGTKAYRSSASAPIVSLM